VSGFFFGWVCWAFWGGDREERRKIRRVGKVSQGVFGLTRKEASVGKLVKVLGSR
jgi:hypothetical protein